MAVLDKTIKDQLVNQIADQVAKEIEEIFKKQGKEIPTNVTYENGKEIPFTLAVKSIVEHLNGTLAIEIFKNTLSVERVLEYINHWDSKNQLELVNKYSEEGLGFSGILSKLAERDEERIQATEGIGKYVKWLNDGKKYKMAKDRLTTELLKEHLAYKGYSIRYNILNGGYEIKGVKGYPIGSLTEILPHILNDELKQIRVIDPGTNEIIKARPFEYNVAVELPGMIEQIALQNCYNPVEELLKKTPLKTDKDYLEEFYKIIDVHDSFSKTLIHKWLLQALAICLYNSVENPFTPEGVLVFQGGQATGKTTIVITLGMRNSALYKVGVSLSDGNKDKEIQATSYFIAELGEMEKTFKKADVEYLKNFATMDIDEHRRPYARASDKKARKTSYVGTCNTTSFLKDETGNRRYWVVPIGNTDIEALHKFEAVYLWKQIENEIKQSAEEPSKIFRLTTEEMDQLNKRNIMYLDVVPGQLELQDIFGMATEKDYCLVYMTSTMLKEQYPVQLRNCNAQQIGRALARLGIEMEKKRINGTIPCNVYQVPIKTSLSVNFTRVEKERVITK